MSIFMHRHCDTHVVTDADRNNQPGETGAVQARLLRCHQANVMRGHACQDADCHHQHNYSCWPHGNMRSWLYAKDKCVKLHTDWTVFRRFIHSFMLPRTRPNPTGRVTAWHRRCHKALRSLGGAHVREALVRRRLQRGNQSGPCVSGEEPKDIFATPRSGYAKTPNPKSM